MATRIIQFISSFHQGGSERQAVQLSVSLLEDGEFDVRLATLEKRGVLLEELDGFEFPAIEEYRLKRFASFGFVRQLFKCAAYLRREKIQIVHILYL